MSLFLDKYNLDRFIGIVGKIKRLETLLNCETVGNVAKVKLIKECVSDIDSVFTEMYKDLVLDPISSVDEIIELERIMGKYESD